MPKPADPTYGRYLLAPHFREVDFANDKDLTPQIQRRRVFFNKDGSIGGSEKVNVTEDELKGVKGKKWIYYEVYTSPMGKGGPGEGCDIIAIHGMGGYGGWMAPLVTSLLAQGFRVVAPDLPGHGRSTGRHVYIKSVTQLSDGVRLVVRDLATWSPPPRKRLLFGISLGGYTALTYCMPGQMDKETAADGAYLECPLIGVTPETDLKPVAWAIAKTLQKTPLAKRTIKEGVADIATNDKRIIEELQNNHRGYQGGIRMGTGVNLLKGLKAIANDAPNFTTPFYIIHGDKDRVTSHERSIKFVAEAAAEDKGITVLPGREHAMYVFGEEPEDRGPRMEVFEKRDAWLINHVQPTAMVA